MDARATALGLGILAGGCFPPVDPPWLEADDPELLALRIEVVEEGELSEMLAPVPADRKRVEGLPGDTITFRPWMLSKAEVVPEAQIDAAYFACAANDCLEAFAHLDVERSCGMRIDVAEPCAIGRGPGARYEIPVESETDPTLLHFVQQVLVVAGEPGARTTDDCIAELADPPFEDLQGCLLLQRGIPIGPQWVIAAVLGANGPSFPDVPPEVLLEPPNFNPELARFVLTDGASPEPIEAPAGGRVTVRAGRRVTLGVATDPRDSQQYAVAASDGTVLHNHEGLVGDWYANEVVSTSDELWQGVQFITWSKPEPGEVRFDALLQDGTGGLAWGSITFDVE